MLDDWGIVPAVEQLIDEEDRAHVQIEFVKDETLGRMAPGIEEALYRITQESLTNAAKHARASSVRVSLCIAGKEIGLRIDDDGKGIAPELLQHPSSHGILGMRERLDALNGSLRVLSTPEQGSEVCARIPLQPPARS